MYGLLFYGSTSDSKLRFNRSKKIVVVVRTQAGTKQKEIGVLAGIVHPRTQPSVSLYILRSRLQTKISGVFQSQVSQNVTLHAENSFEFSSLNTSYRMGLKTGGCQFYG